MSVSNIITEEYRAKINDALAALEQGGKEITLAKRAGLTTFPNGETLLDVEKRYADAKAQLTQIKNIYFPNT